MLEIYFKECLYFSANRLGRIITKMAEDAFAASGVSPTAAFLLMALYEKDGISQKELGQILHLQPSTVTRLIEKLAAKQLLYNRMDGRLSLIYATDKGKSLEALIHQCWDALRERYRTILGDEGDELSLHLYEVCNRLEQPGATEADLPAADPNSRHL
ncbi:MarR family winged helix-turn-helix transcriptional regulator [Cohnella sp. REN36]|uniref:MarR family winged helix-turn-helix transcriptional regulator n=1 Tax=Cohnella sp. REN36 TaxID=2887347 RepID=UPI001D141BD1|nr:MarR family transcriptional regulator [Cohnella sp. REN36]MCC3373784.1 MarR family transcriptional regulator [Cohnella sp. REN36]